MLRFDTNNPILPILPWLWSKRQPGDKAPFSVTRYIALGEEGNPKVIQLPEAYAIMAVGGLLAPVYETWGTDSGANVGAAAGRYSLAKCKALGLPQNCVVWYTQDRDTTPAQMPGVEAAFGAFKDSLGGYYRLGAYASGYCCDTLETKGLIVKKWLTDSMGFMGSRQAYVKGDFDEVQGLPTTLDGMDVDMDTLQADETDIGDAVPVLDIPTTISNGSPAVTWLQARLMVHGATLAIDGDIGPATMDAIKAFQTASKIVVSGVGDATTIAALEVAPQPASA